MSRVLIATHKGLFAASSKGRDWAIACLGFLGEPVSAVLVDPRDGTVFAALFHGHFGPKLHASKDGGTRWTEIACPAFPPAPQTAAERPAVHMVW
ncbi:MAG: exo-alpha-sialidase, partial [Alphaproteobacteria bacterium]